MIFVIVRSIGTRDQSIGSADMPSPSLVTPLVGQVMACTGLSRNSVRIPSAWRPPLFQLRPVWEVYSTSHRCTGRSLRLSVHESMFLRRPTSRRRDAVR